MEIVISSSENFGEQIEPEGFSEEINIENGTVSNDATSFRRNINSGEYTLKPSRSKRFKAWLNRTDDKIDRRDEVLDGKTRRDSQKGGSVFTKQGGGASSTTTVATEKTYGSSSLDEFFAIRPDAGKFKYTNKDVHEAGRDIAVGIDKGASAGMEINDMINKRGKSEAVAPEVKEQKSTTKPVKDKTKAPPKNTATRTNTAITNEGTSTEEKKELTWEEKRYNELEKYGLDNIYYYTKPNGERLYCITPINGSLITLSESGSLENPAENQLLKYKNVLKYAKCYD